jgi:hypothetical protein
VLSSILKLDKAAAALAIVLAALTAAFGCTRGSSDPTAPVREGYRIEAAHVAAEVASSRGPPRRDLLEKAQPPWFAANRGKIFSARLVALWEADDRRFEKTGEISFDADPFLDAQDFDDTVLRDLAIDLVQRAGERVEVRARFTNFGQTTDVRFDVVREVGRWVIDDIRTRGGSIAGELASSF